MFQSFPRLLSENSEWLNGDKRGKHRGEEKIQMERLGQGMGGDEAKEFLKANKGKLAVFQKGAWQ